MPQIGERIHKVLINVMIEMKPRHGRLDRNHGGLNARVNTLAMPVVDGGNLLTHGFITSKRHKTRSTTRIVSRFTSPR